MTKLQKVFLPYVRFQKQNNAKNGTIAKLKQQLSEQQNYESMEAEFANVKKDLTTITNQFEEEKR